MKRYTEEQNRQWQAGLPKKKIAVKVILKSDKGNILLVKPDYKDTWQMSGGGVDEFEDPKVAAVRETEEEAGVRIETSDPRLVPMRIVRFFGLALSICELLYIRNTAYPQ